MRTYTCLTLIALCGIGQAAEPQGLAPRLSRTDYSVTCFTDGLAVAATLVSRDQVRLLFGPELERSYWVVEVGFYSKNHRSYQVSPADFELRPGRQVRGGVKPLPAELLSRQLRSSFVRTGALPDVSTSQAVGGYLFFPIERTATKLLLDYVGNGAWLTLPLQ